MLRTNYWLRNIAIYSLAPGRDEWVFETVSVKLWWIESFFLLLKLYEPCWRGGSRCARLRSFDLVMPPNSLEQSSSRLWRRVQSPWLSRDCLYDWEGAIIDMALFWTRSRSSLRYLERLWWKVGVQYSNTDLINCSIELYNIGLFFLRHSERAVWLKKLKKAHTCKDEKWARFSLCLIQCYVLRREPRMLPNAMNQNLLF